MRLAFIIIASLMCSTVAAKAETYIDQKNMICKKSDEIYKELNENDYRLIGIGEDDVNGFVTIYTRADKNYALIWSRTDDYACILGTGINLRK